MKLMFTRPRSPVTVSKKSTAFSNSFGVYGAVPV
jgi:hypothetical protein